MRKFTPKGSGTAPTAKKTATRPTARTAARPEERPARRPAARSTARPTTRPSRAVARGGEASVVDPAERPARRTAPHPEGRPVHRPPVGPDNRPGRRPATGADDRPARRSAVLASGNRPARPALTATGPAKPALPRKTGPRPGGPGQDRLQKILAAAGIASRRACEQIILDGRVQVNGKTVTELGSCADPRRDEITVDLVAIEREAPVYILMNKPKGYVTTVKDDQGRPTVMALLKGVESRLYPVGRLDFNSEGLLLMTNDGALAQVLMGPEHEIPKVYLVKVHRNPRPELLKEFQEGFLLSGRRLKPCHIEVAEKGDNPWLKVTLTEGKNQQIRRMFAAVGHPVSKLRRVQFGPLADPLLKPGTWRYLSPQEIAAIKSL
jgi:23S rRNA pseudouridine2605 synthase